MANTEKLNDFDKNVERLKNGFNIACKLCNLDVNTFYIIINRHIGDAARVLQILQSIRDYYGEKANRYHFADGHSTMNPIAKVKQIKKIIIVTTKSISGVAKLYSYAFDSMIVISRAELDDLELYSCSPCAIHQNIICDENAYRIVYRRWQTDEGNWIRSSVTGVGDLRWYLCLPPKLKITDMKINADTARDTDLIVSKYFKDIKKSVIICPYAQSSSMLPAEIWVSFAKAMHNEGFQVYTNAFGDETAIDGTKILSVDMDIMVCLAKRGCYIIGVQSGLMDVLVRCETSNITVLNIIRTNKDIQFAKSRKAINEVNIINGITYLRLEHFEEDYVLKLLMDNFH